ncbi:MAG: FAD-dependent tricarballylate dehydrogenase TcuA [Chloroflexi bacterium]|nr:FAD-dependent tricarballylate dehydrogenase TcuA [Chloroflexota bacterium]
MHTQVLVVGAGNAGMSAAVAAKERGAQVVIIEKAPREHRGGNSALTGHMRLPYEGIEDLVPLVPNMSEQEIRHMAEHMARKRYLVADFYDDVMRVTDGRSDPDLLEIVVTQAYPTARWMRDMGHEWVPSYANPVSANVVSFNGGGYGLQERWFAVAERMGIPIHYGTAATELLEDDMGRVTGVRALTPQGYRIFRAKAVIMACGGFESNAEMRARYLGPGWDTVKMRGVPFNTGEGLRMALEIGALPAGSWSSCHASPQDLNRPPFGLPALAKLGDEWNRYSYPFGIMVNVHGRRFVDEGETWRGLTYAKTGRAVLAQPQGVAFQIFDAKCRRLDVIRDYERATGAKANSLEGLAEQLGVAPKGLVETVREFNAAVQPGEFNPFALDGKRAVGITPPKSNWALTVDTPPFEGFPVCCGITFTFGGLRINTKAQVVHVMDRPIPGLYAVGEMMGGLWHWNYPSGSGMAAGSVFGRIAGTTAAQEAVG